MRELRGRQQEYDVLQGRPRRTFAKLGITFRRQLRTLQTFAAASCGGPL